jgi:hypothetical protein
MTRDGGEHLPQPKLGLLVFASLFDLAVCNTKLADYGRG